RFSPAVVFSYFCISPDLSSCPTRRSSDLDRAHRQRALGAAADDRRPVGHLDGRPVRSGHPCGLDDEGDGGIPGRGPAQLFVPTGDRKSTRLNSSHVSTSYAVFFL